ncbi:hypothetical protein DICPUDRAFT_95074 [Dictyostelium purpureum]|uniref:Uncharacterized protein n=1 Tax=Dictyostelium purpureum TaxID=5786 RepID=F0ZRY9_DICPU|nr:uncharacterized protein DICPUDRAFT_95074 [Dictyostelium purpureum]EGC33279.1 hypothetical protein DICPUDRAFT_95074 [Dictyostelium purpureum]|eukprot:XP_003290180.1 hypothetical protein DICPUDRAFT_95074 [Dictyostelium purpureum]
MEAKSSPVPINTPEDKWGLWKAEWKTWWGDVLGNDTLKNQGLEERTKIRGHLRGTPMRKSPSFNEENLASSINIGVHGNKVENQSPYTGASTFFPEWKYPSFERNKYDDEILEKQREKTLDLRVGSGSL